jgi:hypothetical protein
MLGYKNMSEKVWSLKKSIPPSKSQLLYTTEIEFSRACLGNNEHYFTEPVRNRWKSNHSNQKDPPCWENGIPVTVQEEA